VSHYRSARASAPSSSLPQTTSNACRECRRGRQLKARGLCVTCYAKARRRPGYCTHCGHRAPIYAKGECKPCRDAYYRGSR
jgi:hypothetical protein